MELQCLGDARVFAYAGRAKCEEVDVEYLIRRMEESNLDDDVVKQIGARLRLKTKQQIGGHIKDMFQHGLRRYAVYLNNPQQPPPCYFGWHHWWRQWIRMTFPWISASKLDSLVDESKHQ